MTRPARSSSREIPVHHRSIIPTSLPSPRSSFISLALLTPSALFLFSRELACLLASSPLFPSSYDLRPSSTQRGMGFGSAAVAFGIGPGSLASAGEKEHSSGGPVHAHLTICLMFTRSSPVPLTRRPAECDCPPASRRRATALSACSARHSPGRHRESKTRLSEISPRQSTRTLNAPPFPARWRYGGILILTSPGFDTPISKL